MAMSNAEFKDSLRKRGFLELYNKYYEAQSKESKNGFVFDILGFAKSLGLEVYTTDSEKPDFSGSIEGNRILVNANHGANRKRFTLAHEIGHFILHDSKKRFRDDGRERMPDEQDEEVEANSFASNLLMPENIIKDKFDFTKDDAELAKQFGVSQEAYIYRRVKLGILR